LDNQITKNEKTVDVLMTFAVILVTSSKEF
jgi:hypothetical protein